MVAVKMQVHASSLQSFKKNVSIAGRGVAGSTRKGLAEFCETVLYDSTMLVPIDTGALANSADYKITGTKTQGYKAQLGYGIGRRNPVNRRTGLPASAYAGSVHETFKRYQNGQPKFFETALLMHEQELETYTGKEVRKYLSNNFLSEVDDSISKDEAWRTLIAGRMQESFTEQVEGKLLPFPVPHGMIYFRGGRWFLNHDFYKKSDKQYRHGVKGKSTKKTTRSIRDKEITRHSIKSAVKPSSKKRSTSKKIKESRTAPSKRKVEQHKFISDLAHETALDEFIQAMLDEAKEKRKRKKKEKEEKKRWS